MSRIRYAALSALIVIATFAGAMISSQIFTARLVEAQQVGEAKRANAPQWEYCALIRGGEDYRESFGKITTTVKVVYFRSSGNQEEKVQAEADKNALQNARDEAQAKAMAKLGSEGWEMVGPGAEFRADALYFKRPKS